MGISSLGDLITRRNLGLISSKAFREPKHVALKFIPTLWVDLVYLAGISRTIAYCSVTAQSRRCVSIKSAKIQSFWQAYEREPTSAELAEQPMSMEVADTIKISGRHLSVDAPFNDGEDNRLLDVISVLSRRQTTVSWHESAVGFVVHLDASAKQRWCVCGLTGQ